MAHLIGHEGEGSVFAHLKSKGECVSVNEERREGGREREGERGREREREREGEREGGREGEGERVCVSSCTGWCNSLEAGPAAGAKGYDFFVIRMVLSSEGEGKGGSRPHSPCMYIFLVGKGS